MTTLSDTPTENTFQAPAPPSGKLRWLLLGLCGALLALLLASGAMAVKFLDDMHSQELAVTRALAERTQMLSGLWLSIQSYNQAVQQYVAQSNADRAEADRQRIDEIALEIDSFLRSYPRNRDPMEAAMLNFMQDLFSQERTLYVTILTARPEQVRREAENQMAKRRAPLQQQILDWSGKMRTWNDERLHSADRALAGQFESLQGGLGRTLAIGFTSGLVLVLGSMLYIARLERQTRNRYVALARSQHEMQLLSSRLVDAQETERRSISRELHDEVGQDLGAMLVTIGRLSSELPAGDPRMKEELDHLKSMAERTFRSVRNMALLLRPSMLDDLGLAAALEWQGREVSRRSQIEVAVEAESLPEEMPDDYNICVYRLVQEALNNAVRHSGARNARVTVAQRNGEISVRVSDDGHGFDPNARGMGILGMEERVKRLGGKFAIESRDGQGATVIAELPLPVAVESRA